MNARKIRLFISVPALIILLLSTFYAVALAQLPGSNFEIEDGNTQVDGAAPSIDWDEPSISGDITVVGDEPSGQDDDSFGQGTKEDSEVPVVVSGSIPPNPAELIDSKRLFEFIEETKTEFDVVIFDTPPILSTADAAILGTKLDATVLVYRVGSISRRLLKRATVQLEQVKAKILGVVLNGMKAEVSPDFQDFLHPVLFQLFPALNDQTLHLFIGKKRLFAAYRILQPLDKFVEINLDSVVFHAETDLVADAVAFLVFLGLKGWRFISKEIRWSQHQKDQRQKEPFINCLYH